MRKHLLLATGACAAAFLIPAQFDCAAAAQSAAALAGEVRSAKEGAMDGVVVSAKRDGSTITISVVSDDKGRYSFPAVKLPPGHYSLKIRAVGYDLKGPNAVDVKPGAVATADLTLNPTKDLPAQLSNGEWLASMPGTDQQKKFLLACDSCHTYRRIVDSTHTADEFLQVFERMSGYYPGSTPLHPQRLVGTARREISAASMQPGGANAALRSAAEWLTTVNLSKGPERRYALTTLPRPSGRATHVVITEYDLPRKTIEPHDVITDADGTVWYSDFGEMFIGKLNPKTGTVTEYPIPQIKPGFPTGTLDLEPDQDGNLWVGLMYQGGVAKFDKKTGKFQTWSVPKQWQTDATQQAFVSPTSFHVDGKVWVKNSDGSQILRLDPATGQWENLGSFSDPETKRPIGSYGINADRDNNLYMLDFRSGDIGILNAKTRTLAISRTVIPNSRPRRGEVDEQNRLWFAEYDGNTVGMLDPKTKRITEWAMPTAWTNPYDVTIDKNGEAWTSSMMNDRVVRLDTKTDRFVEYLLPNPTNVRRVWVDNATTPVTFWVGSVHGASIVKLEPLD
jgi:virginiamycin B lyase